MVKLVKDGVYLIRGSLIVTNANQLGIDKINDRLRQTDLEPF